MQKLLVGMMLLGLTACQNKTGGGAAQANPTTEDQKTFYALGLSVGRNISVFNMTPEELAYVKAGMDAQVLGQKPAVDIQEYGPKLNQLARTRSEAQATQEKEKSKGFLDAAAKEQGAQKTESGLVYKSLREGTGPSPLPTDTVKVNYRGTLPDGKEFDSSYARNEPATFPLNGVIKCWTEGLQKMKVGGKAKLTCPSDLAYGDRGAPPNIPGGATLVFEVELLEIVKPGATPGQPPAPTAKPTEKPADKPAPKSTK